MRLSKKIKEYRLEKGWTQYDLAKFSGVSLGSIKRYETDNGNITYANLEKIANAFQKDISNFQNNKMSLSMSPSQDINLSLSQDKYVSKSPNLSPSKPLNAPNLKKSQDITNIPYFEDTYASAGSGIIIYDETPIGMKFDINLVPCIFKDYWLFKYTTYYKRQGGLPGTYLNGGKYYIKSFRKGPTVIRGVFWNTFNGIFCQKVFKIPRRTFKFFCIAQYDPLNRRGDYQCENYE